MIADVAVSAAPGWFKVGQLTESAIVAFGANPASLYLLLCKRVRYQGDRAGQTEQPYCHTKTAELFGCSRRHLYDCLMVLVEAKAVSLRRTRDGHHVTILGYPRAQSRREPAFPSEPAPEQMSTPVPISESEVAPTFPSGREPAFPSSIPIQESLNQEGEKTPIVVQATASAPPILETADETTRDAILLEESRRRHRFSESVRTTLVYALSGVPEVRRAAVVRTASTVMAEHPRWNQDAPETWRGQIQKAADASQLKSYRPPPESVFVPPPPDPDADQRSRAAAEHVRQLLAAKGLAKRNEAVRQRFGAVA